MQAVILAGGFGTRLGEETERIPKPMVRIGDRPLLWHIMQLYTVHGVRDFVVCLGYRGYVIKEYFANFPLHHADVTMDLAAGSMEVHQPGGQPWRVTLVETGIETMTGGRIKRAAPYLRGDAFCLTYGDGLSDLDIGRTIAFHRGHGKLATVTAVHPPGRFGALQLDGDLVRDFHEKPAEGAWINGGFFVLSPGVLELIPDDSVIWEADTLERLARDGQLAAFRHEGFWHPVDTPRDKLHLEELWRSGSPPWKTWS